MRRDVLALIALIAFSAGAARAEPPNAQDWSGRLDDFLRSLTGKRAADHEIIKPPGDIDRKMVLVPRQPQARMWIVPPPDTGR